MFRELVRDIYNKIAEQNAKNNMDAVPHSDSFLKMLVSSMGVTDHDIRQVLNILKESHKIFIFEILKEDKQHDVKKIEGYVITDLPTISRLKTFYQNLLMSEYEKQFKTRMLVHQIVKEVYQKAHLIKNTPLGQIANKAIMLEEFQNLIEKHYDQYVDEWQQKKLNELIMMGEQALQAQKKVVPEEESREQDSTPAPLGIDIPSDRRAIDTEAYASLLMQDQQKSLKKVLSIYGVEFFFRVNLRKYNFDIIRDAIERGEIDRKTDLKLLKNMIQNMKSNFERDPGLVERQDALYKLERTASRFILISPR